MTMFLRAEKGQHLIDGAQEYFETAVVFCFSYVSQWLV